MIGFLGVYPSVPGGGSRSLYMAGWSTEKDPEAVEAVEAAAEEEEAVAAGT